MPSVNSNGLPSVVSVQKKYFPLLIDKLVSVQPTKQPIATVYGMKRVEAPDDGSGWRTLEFTFDRWSSEVAAIKLKTPITLEVVQDMASMGISIDVVTEHIADHIADDINKDIFDKLRKIASRELTPVQVDQTLDEYNQARVMYAKIHAAAAKMERETGMTATYVLCSTEVYSKMLSSSFVTKSEDETYAVANSGLYVVHDKYSAPGDEYFVVGVKKRVGDSEMSALVYSTYDVDESILEYANPTIDPDSLQPIIPVLARYTVTAAPLENGQRGLYVIDWDNITDAQRSQLARHYEVIFP
ncbi:major head protein [Vibrio phage EniLVp02]